MGDTTIRVTEGTHGRLVARGRKADSFDTIIVSLLDDADMRIAATARMLDPAFHRKMIVRKELLEQLVEEGVCLAPFNESIIEAAYQSMKVYGIGTDVRDLTEEDGPFNVVDFDNLQDPSNNPYGGFDVFWKSDAMKATEMVVFFTDDRRAGILSNGSLVRPTGSKKTITVLAERRKVFHGYFDDIVLPWFEKKIAPYTIVAKRKVMDNTICLWGAYIALQEDGADE